MLLLSRAAPVRYWLPMVQGHRGTCRVHGRMDTWAHRYMGAWVLGYRAHPSTARGTLPHTILALSRSRDPYTYMAIYICMAVHTYTATAGSRSRATAWMAAQMPCFLLPASYLLLRGWLRRRRCPLLHACNGSGDALYCLGELVLPSADALEHALDGLREFTLVGCHGLHRRCQD